ncbi:MAG: DUF1566 domain-containing protein [SAR324 cluster bacterium]|nr:DUF1566 domain-containing protein [SAR324 cluster bacterium]
MKPQNHSLIIPLMSLLMALQFAPQFALAEPRTVVEEGIAYIGNGITVEDAQKVAVNDARQKALNGMGAFIESSRKTSGGRLTAKDISSITGAVMQSRILEEKKEVEGSAFLLKLKVEFQIDMDSFNRALSRYQEQSQDKQVISQLMASMQKLQEQLLKSQKGSFETVEIADEIAFNTKKLGDLLTTRQVIDNELEIQEIYTQKVKTIILNEIIPRMTPALREVLVWQKVPQEDGDRLILPCETNATTEAYFKEALNKLKQLAVEYDSKGFKTRPKLEFESRFVTFWSMHINQDEYGDFFSTSISGNAREVWMTPHSCNKYNLPDKYNLTNVNSVEWRVKPTHPGSLGLQMFKKTVYGPDEEHTFTLGGGLMFRKTDDWNDWYFKRNWSDAVNYCKQLKYAGHSDWRLPEIHELEGLWYSGRRWMLDSSFYWSSSTYAVSTYAGNTSYAWGVYFNDGYVNYNGKTDSYYVRCVRGGQ